jgi:7-cyano-7-deazaguanine synthase
MTAVDLSGFGGSALTDSSIDVPIGGLHGGIPVTYVPARNTIFLSLALAFAEVRGARDIFFGANAVDYSGYPDCRPEYMRAFEVLANLATKAAVEGHKLELHTPIIALSKADIVRRGIELDVDYSLTVSCYQATESGEACAVCDACRLRSEGFKSAGIPDPTRYSSSESGSARDQRTHPEPR